MIHQMAYPETIIDNKCISWQTHDWLTCISLAVETIFKFFFELCKRFLIVS